MLSESEKNDVVREWLEKHAPGEFFPPFRTAQCYYEALIDSVAPKPKSAIGKALEVFDKEFGDRNEWSYANWETVKAVRAGIAAIDDGEVSKAK